MTPWMKCGLEPAELETVSLLGLSLESPQSQECCCSVLVVLVISWCLALGPA